MSQIPPRVPEDPATSFLLAEHQRISELYLSTRETAERRTTLFLTLTTTILGVIVALFQLRLPLRDFLETALAGTIGIALLGAITFHRLIERSMQGTEYLRAINRIHRYFVECAPGISPYLYWPACDDIPRYDAQGVGGAETREIVMLIDSAFVGVTIALATFLATQSQLLIALVLGFVAILLAVRVHGVYEKFVMLREERRKAEQVLFPQRSS